MVDNIIMEDVKIKLAAIWISRILTGFLGDVLRFFQPGFLEEIIVGDIDGIAFSNEILMVLAVIIGIPIYMIYPSLILRDKTNRRLNIIVGTFMVLFDLVFLITIIPSDPAWEIFLGFVYLMFTSLVVWTAWKWRVQEAS